MSRLKMSNRGRASGRRFDREHGTTTQAVFLLSQLDARRRAEAYAHATHYEPVSVEAFHALLACVPEAFIRASTFVDVGSGMGRALLLAAEYPFTQVVGIELSPALHAIACENIAVARGLAVRCRDVRLRCGDARRFAFPKGNLVVFLFNPFDDEALGATLARIVGGRAATDGVIVLYHTPVHRYVLLERAGETIAEVESGLVVRLRRCPGRRDPSASRC